jgi:hypothetical protein
MAWKASLLGHMTVSRESESKSKGETGWKRGAKVLGP